MVVSCDCHNFMALSISAAFSSLAYGQQALQVDYLNVMKLEGVSTSPGTWKTLGLPQALASKPKCPFIMTPHGLTQESSTPRLLIV